MITENQKKPEVTEIMPMHSVILIVIMIITTMTIGVWLNSEWIPLQVEEIPPVVPPIEEMICIINKEGKEIICIINKEGKEIICIINKEGHEYKHYYNLLDRTQEIEFDPSITWGTVGLVVVGTLILYLISQY